MEMKRLRAENKIIMQTGMAVRTSTTTIREKVEQCAVKLTRVSAIVDQTPRAAYSQTAPGSTPSGAPVGGSSAGSGGGNISAPGTDSTE